MTNETRHDRPTSVSPSGPGRPGHHPGDPGGHLPRGEHPGGRVASSLKGNHLRLLFWETTSLCNLECVHCRRLDVAQELAQSDMTTEQAKAFLDSVAEVATPILVLSGGEPLMRRDIFDLAAHARGRGFTLALATNGTLVDRPMAGEIARVGVRRVAISIDGADAPTHDGFRRLPGSFDAALAGLAHLKAVGLSLQLNCTVARHNVDQLEAIYDLALTVGADALHLFLLVPVGCGVEINAEQQITPQRYEEILTWFYRKSREGKIETKATCAPHYHRVVRQQARAEGATLTPQTHGLAAMTRGCLAGTGVCFVSHKGEVFPCGYLPVEAGHVLTQPFQEIWERSPVFAQLRDLGLLTGKCGLCEYKTVCEGCRARAYGETGDFLAEEPYCIYVPQRARRQNAAG